MKSTTGRRPLPVSSTASNIVPPVSNNIPLGPDSGSFEWGIVLRSVCPYVVAIQNLFAVSVIGSSYYMTYPLPLQCQFANNKDYVDHVRLSADFSVAKSISQRVTEHNPCHRSLSDFETFYQINSEWSHLGSIRHHWQLTLT